MAYWYLCLEDNNKEAAAEQEEEGIYCFVDHSIECFVVAAISGFDAVAGVDDAVGIDGDFGVVVDSRNSSVDSWDCNYSSFPVDAADIRLNSPLDLEVGNF